MVSYNAQTRQLRVRCPRLKGATAWIPKETTHVDLSKASDGEYKACRLEGPPWRYEDIKTVYSAQGSQLVNVHARMGKFKGQRNLPYTAVTRAMGKLKVSGVELNDGGCDVREKCELHPKSVLYQAELGVGGFSAERIEQARLQVAQANEGGAAMEETLVSAAVTNSYCRARIFDFRPRSHFASSEVTDHAWLDAWPPIDARPQRSQHRALTSKSRKLQR